MKFLLITPLMCSRSFGGKAYGRLETHRKNSP
jgi:hypothetical protein